MKDETSFISVFYSTFKTFSCLFILVVFTVVFSLLSGFYLLVPLKLHVVDTAMMAITFTLLALLGALLAGVLYVSASLFLSKENAARVVIIYGLLGFVVAAYEFNKTAKLWMLKVFPNAFPKLGIIEYFGYHDFLVAAIYVSFSGTRYCPKPEKERDRCFKAVCVLFSASIIAYFSSRCRPLTFDTSKKWPRLT